VPKGRYLAIWYQDLASHHPAVWQRPDVLGTFVQLLALAEDSWPRRPPIPATVRRQMLTLLIDEGLVIPVDGGAYTIRGLDALRQRRAAKAAAAANGRWQRELAELAAEARSNAQSNARSNAGGDPPRNATSNATSNAHSNATSTAASNAQSNARAMPMNMNTSTTTKELPRAAAAALGSSRGGTSSGGPARAKPWSILRPSAAAADAARDNKP
jgi:hypothetical protein